MGKEIKILVLIKNKLNGVLFYRSVIPHSYMLGRWDVNITFKDNLFLSKHELEKFDIIHTSYSLLEKWDIERIKKANVKLIVDVDDYWILDRFHELYDKYKDKNIPDKIKFIIRSANAITTTSEALRKKILPLCSKVGVISNTLMDDDYVRPKHNPIPYMAWLGASNHTMDLMEIQHLQMGFQFPVYIPEMYRTVFKNRFLYYQRQQVPNYLGLYNEYEIILAPLRANKFNQYKSPLKLMEAGFFKKPLIISDVEPFKPYLKHKENCLAVRKKSEWAKWAKLLSKDKELRTYLGENLKATVDEHFNIDKFSEKRWEFYKEVVGG